FPGLARDAAARARETYWIAFFRARQQRSLNGVLHAAEAFAMLGDRSTVEQCMRVAEGLAARAGDAEELDRVRQIASRLAEQAWTSVAANRRVGWGRGSPSAVWTCAARRRPCFAALWTCSRSSIAASITTRCTSPPTAPSHGRNSSTWARLSMRRWSCSAATP